MCGIAGIVECAGTPINRQELQRILTTLRHRGPDDEGYLLWNGEINEVASLRGPDSPAGVTLPLISEIADRGQYTAALGHRRLAILDLSTKGHQPMQSADGTLWIVFNGEIYNYVELRSELTAKGHRFRTGTDTEVLLAAFSEWREGMLRRLQGMFALAILDLEKRSLFLARDPFGVKPLYYAVEASGRLVFASEAKALLQSRGAGRAANPTQLYNYLRFGNTDAGSETMFSGIQQLPAAHFAECSLDDPGKVRPVRYWEIRGTGIRNVTLPEAAEEVRSIFLNSVRLHLRSDAPLGACLSGGLDSTAIVLAMQQLRPQGADDLDTFSFITDEPVLGEEQYVDLVRGAQHPRSHKVKPAAADIPRDIDDLIRLQDFPFGGTGIYAQYRVFQLAQRCGVKVILDGQGGDELFGGYPTAIAAKVAAYLSSFQVANAGCLLRGAALETPGLRRRVLLAALGRLLPRGVAGVVMGAVGESLFPTWMERSWFESRGVQGRPRPQGRGRNGLREELLLSLQDLILPQLLRYEDRNSMAFSIESRVPFCNTDLAECALSLPESFLISKDGVTKVVFREAMRGIVPLRILKRPKVAFAAPERQWLNELRPWVRDTVNSALARDLPFLRHAGVRRLADSQLNGVSLMAPSTWRIVNLIHWARIFDIVW